MQKNKAKYIGPFFLICGFLFLFPTFFAYFEEMKKEENIEKYIAGHEENDSYLGVLEIPVLRLKQGFYSNSSLNNTVDKNVQLIENSTMPDEEDNNLILAAHSGNSKVSYFKYLYQLNINDIAIIYYQKKRYVYKYVYKYQELKDGTISIRKEQDQSQLILTTCNNKIDYLQDVYVFFLLESDQIV